MVEREKMIEQGNANLQKVAENMRPSLLRLERKRIEADLALLAALAPEGR